MQRYYICKDGKIEASTASRKNAIDLIRSYQQKETHYLVRSVYSIIKGEEEFIQYK